ncbi:MAG: helix-turn-helix domain-containing protein [Oscillospiraceae bacterium]|nr:helix-turn-helix domain-containing protein [Oscillospiraceae bacterium]
MAKKPVYLTEEQREILKDFSKNGTHNAHLITRAKILLVLDRTGKKDHMRITRTANDYGVSRETVYNIIDDFHNAKNIDEFLQRKPRETPPIPPKATGDIEAHIIALACSEPPAGYARWTVRLLASKAVELNFIDSISPSTVHRLLKKRNIDLI